MQYKSFSVINLVDQNLLEHWSSRQIGDINNDWHHYSYNNYNHQRYCSVSVISIQFSLNKEFNVSGKIVHNFLDQDGMLQSLGEIIHCGSFCGLFSCSIWKSAKMSLDFPCLVVWLKYQLVADFVENFWRRFN